MTSYISRPIGRYDVALISRSYVKSAFEIKRVLFCPRCGTLEKIEDAKARASYIKLGEGGRGAREPSRCQIFRETRREFHEGSAKPEEGDEIALSRIRRDALAAGTRRVSIGAAPNFECAERFTRSCPPKSAGDE